MKRFTFFIFEGSMKRLTASSSIRKSLLHSRFRICLQDDILVRTNIVAHVGASVARSAVIA